MIPNYLIILVVLLSGFLIITILLIAYIFMKQSKENSNSIYATLIITGIVASFIVSMIFGIVQKFL